MTVREMLDTKYAAWLKEMGAREWRYIKAQPVHPAEYMYMCLEITADDIRENGGWTGEFWAEINAMHGAKLLASNKHRQHNGQVTKYWLTKKGWATINKDHAIC